jgi:glycosyltransferase involved in cell wall biosynthesis
LRETNPDIFHVHLNWPLACRHHILAARIFGVPAIVATSHLISDVSEVRFLLLKQCLQSALVDRYIAVSNEVGERLRWNHRVPKSKIRVIQNGIGIPAFHRTPDSKLRYTLTGGREQPIVFTPARLHSQKGHLFLLQAVKLAPDALFVFAGEGPERDFLEHYAEEIGVRNRIRFLGHRNDVPQLLASCDLFVLPSLYEGLPLSVLEAMAASKPVIATSIGGTDEAVIDGETGLLVPPENPQSLAVAIRRLLSDQPYAARLAEAGQIRVAQLFSAVAMSGAVMKVYDELISGKRTNAISEREPNNSSPQQVRT